MQSRKSHFPVFTNIPSCVYLDSAATTQKPQKVIDGIKLFLENSYANIHRGSYSLSEQSEDLYEGSKQKVCQSLVSGAKPHEIIYTYNATYAYNFLAQSLFYSGILQPGDGVLLDIGEHHANVVPRQMLAQRHGIFIERINLQEDFDYDLIDFENKYTDKIKVVSLSGASNVTGRIYNIQGVANLLRDDTFFIVDGSQLIPHSPVTVKSNHIDALVFTAHKFMADTGLGVIFLDEKRHKTFTPAWGGGGAIEEVTQEKFRLAPNSQKFEPGTPHIVGAVSLGLAIDFLEEIGGYPAIQQYEEHLIRYTLEQFAKRDHITLIGPKEVQKRTATFSFTSPRKPTIQIGEYLGMHNVCVRAGGHCTHPFYQKHNLQGSCRASAYIYNDTTDIDTLFTHLDAFLLT